MDCVFRNHLSTAADNTQKHDIVGPMWVSGWASVAAETHIGPTISHFDNRGSLAGGDCFFSFLPDAIVLFMYLPFFLFGPFMSSSF